MFDSHQPADSSVTVSSRPCREVSFTGELFRPDDTGLAVTYAGSARIEVTFVPTGEPETITTTGLARYLIDFGGKADRLRCGFLHRRLQQLPTNVDRARP
jgi:hypothetical protein